MATTETLSQRVDELDENDDNIGAEIEEGEEDNGEVKGASEYEQTRKKQIKENMERMQKLGIFDASLKLKSAVLESKGVRKRKALDFKNTAVKEAGLLPRVTRRSSRLQNVTPVSYAEVEVEKRGNSTRNRDLYLEVGSKEEVYTEEHDKLLGDCNMSWTFFVDGYGKDGKRIYDPVKGKTCHQCRQKTLGHRTTCSKCNLVQGQFCGDCLYMRYGEHVLEANQNPDWVCPPCRGICNCSLCRQAKGWAPTGTLYRKISSLGYKSVAHFLVQTGRSQTNDGINQAENDEKKDAGMNVEHGQGTEHFGIDLNSGDDTEVKINSPLDNFLTDYLASEVNDGNKQVRSIMHVKEKNFASESMGIDIRMEIVKTERKTDLETPVHESDLATKISNADVGNKVNDGEHLSSKGIFTHESICNITTPDKTSTRKRRQVTVAPCPDSIAGRLRLRRNRLICF